MLAVLKPLRRPQSLPRRAEYDPTNAASFREDVLGPLWVPSAVLRAAGERSTSSQYAAPPPPRPSQGSERGYEPCGTAQATETNTAAQREKANPQHVTHEWGQKEGAWMCRACLAQSRATHPPTGRCPGYAARIRDAALDPKGHNLLYSTFANGEPGIVVICSHCGHYTTSKRACFQERCVGPQSSGAKAHYERVSRGLHPKHARGDARILNPLQRLSHLIATCDDKFSPQVP